MPGGFLKEFYNKGTGERGGLNQALETAPLV